MDNHTPSTPPTTMMGLYQTSASARSSLSKVGVVTTDESMKIPLSNKTSSTGKDTPPIVMNKKPLFSTNTPKDDDDPFAHLTPSSVKSNREIMSSSDHTLSSRYISLMGNSTTTDSTANSPAQISDTNFAKAKSESTLFSKFLEHPKPQHQQGDNTTTVLANNLKELSSELSSMFTSEEQKQRQLETSNAVMKQHKSEQERQDRLMTLGDASSKSARQLNPAEERLQVRSKSMKSFKKITSFSTKKKDERVATRSSSIPSPPTSPTSAKTLSTRPQDASNATSEFEPSVHQCEISPISDIYLSAQICSFMEDYRTIDQNFDLSLLNNRPQSEYSQIIMTEQQQPIIQMISNFNVKDLTLRGFFILGTSKRDGDAHHRTECSIFVSEIKRQFIVCIRGDTEQQNKPIKLKEISKKVSKAKTLDENNHSSSQLIYPKFYDAYHENKVEQVLFPFLQELSEIYPFFDLVFTGWSLGGVLSLVASIRYSFLNSMMRVYYFGYGVPKVGCSHGISNNMLEHKKDDGNNWRGFVHSLSNLMILRMEYGSDQYINLPEGNSRWVHAGHSLRIPSISQTNNYATPLTTPKAFKFDKFRPMPKPMEAKIRQFSSTSIKKNLKMKISKDSSLSSSTANENDHHIHSYVKVLEKYHKKEEKWVKTFVGEDGSGVIGKNSDEKRLLV